MTIVQQCIISTWTVSGLPGSRRTAATGYRAMWHDQAYPTTTFKDVLIDHPLLGQPLRSCRRRSRSSISTGSSGTSRRWRRSFAPLRAIFAPTRKRIGLPAVARRQIAAGAIGDHLRQGRHGGSDGAGGIDDVFIANQVVAAQAIERMCMLAQQAKVTVAVDTARNVADLAAAARAIG